MAIILARGSTWERIDECEPAGDVGMRSGRGEVAAFEGSPAKKVGQGAGVSDEKSAECKAGIQMVKKGSDGCAIVGRGQVHVGVNFA